jgi:hypothetical protein
VLAAIFKDKLFSIPMDQTEISKLNSTLKVLLEYEKLFSEDYAQIVSAKLETLTHLINTLKEDKVLLPTWKIWSEAILIKFSYHTSSFLQLYNGTVLPYKNGKKPIIIFDEPTLIVIFRCILENYLTFFYLYLDKISEEEKEFRVLIWRYSGTKQRTEFIIQSEEAKEKQEKETAYLATLKDEIISTAFFEQFDAKRKQAILKVLNQGCLNHGNHWCLKVTLEPTFFKIFTAISPTIHTASL